MKKTYLDLGNPNVICDRCGFKLKMSQLQEEPRTGLMVCSKCWESWHPQELVRPIRAEEPLPWTRPEPTDVYITGICTVIGRQGVAGLGVAGCAIAGLDLGMKDTHTITSA